LFVIILGSVFEYAFPGNKILTYALILVGALSFIDQFSTPSVRSKSTQTAKKHLMITCIGNPVFDSITTLRIKSNGRVLSGCSTNACLALSKLGMDATLVGRIGADFAEQFKSQMQFYNIRYFVEESEQSGGFKLIYTDTKGSRTLDLLGDAGKINSFPQELSSSDWILFGPILLEIDLEYIKHIKDTTQAKFFCRSTGFNPVFIRGKYCP